MNGLNVRPDGRPRTVRCRTRSAQNCSVPSGWSSTRRSLAQAQQVTRIAIKGGPLLERVRDNRRVLRAMQAQIADAVTDERWITPSAEWLLDNFYIVDEQLREIRDDLPAASTANSPS